MSLLNQVFNGNPNTSGVLAQGGLTNAPNLGIDTANGTIYLSAGAGWVPLTGVAQKAIASAQAGNNANVTTFTAPAAGLYEVDLYAVSTNTPTAATLPAMTATYTDADSNASVTQTIADVGSVASPGVVNSGKLFVNLKAGGTVVVATTSYDAGSGTALTYNVKSRVSFLG